MTWTLLLVVSWGYVVNQTYVIPGFKTKQECEEAAYKLSQREYIIGNKKYKSHYCRKE